MEKLYKNDDYKDVLIHIQLSYDEMIKRIIQYKLVFSNICNNTIECGIKLPMFVRAFYVYVFKYKDIPTQQQFFDFYLKFNNDFFSKANLDNDLMEGLKARVYRSYPSIIRDICFNKYVKENINGYTVKYSLELDVNEGIDLMISNDEKNYAVNLYTDTRRAYLGREKKQFRHKPFDNVTYIEFPVVFNESNRVGDFFLYGEKEYNDLISKLI